MKGEYLPCPSPEGDPECPLYKTKQGCHESDHHDYWPSNIYKTVIERAFRNLPDNRTEMCRRIHSELHATEEPPEKPDEHTMRSEIIAADMAGQVCLSATRRRAVYGR